MKQVIFLILFLSSCAYAQRVEVESGLYANNSEFGLRVSANYINYNHTIAGVGIVLTGLSNYDYLKTPAGEVVDFGLPFYDKLLTRGTYGAGAGLRVITKFGVAIEGGVIVRREQKWTQLNLAGASIRNLSSDIFKGTPYGMIQMYSKENRYTIGLMISDPDHTGLSLGYRLF